MRFFADHCVPMSIIKSLRDAGHDVLCLRDYIPLDSSDEVVIATAQELNCILISLDGDFANIVAYPPTQYKGIIVLQIRNHPEVISLIMERLNDYLSRNSEMSYYEGKLFLIETHRIRIWQ